WHAIRRSARPYSWLRVRHSQNVGIARQPHAYTRKVDIGPAGLFHHPPLDRQGRRECQREVLDVSLARLERNQGDGTARHIEESLALSASTTWIHRSHQGVAPRNDAADIECAIL